MKITITFELELADQNTEEQKMEIIHKIDQLVETLEPVDMVKRTVVAYPFHRHGVSFDGGRSWGRSHELQKYLTNAKTLSKSDFEREYYNNPTE